MFSECESVSSLDCRLKKIFGQKYVWILGVPFKCIFNHLKEIYKNHLAVSAECSVDCPKSDRLKLYTLFADSYNTPENAIGQLSTFKPVYEDTFNPIEEFLLISLYDEWKVFMETEEKFFKNV